MLPPAAQGQASIALRTASSARQTRPGGEVQRIVGVVLGGLSVRFRCLGVELVALAVDAVMEVLHLRRCVGPDRLPVALRAMGGLPGFSRADSWLAAMSALTRSTRTLTCSRVSSRA
jgi:hypothetical protein